MVDTINITKDMIKRGYEQGIVKLIPSDNVYDNNAVEVLKDSFDIWRGVVCRIGKYWFYFDCNEAEEQTVTEYKNNHSGDEISQRIIESLDDFKKYPDTLGDEYLYYYYFLIENLK